MRNRSPLTVALTIATLTGLLALNAAADPFDQDDLANWQQQFDKVVLKGEHLFHGGLTSNNTVACDQCHPNATNTHPETYPKFQKQLGKVAVLAEMINWCIRNPLESDPLTLDDADMIALQAYILHERSGVPLSPGRH